MRRLRFFLTSELGRIILGLSFFLAALVFEFADRHTSYSFRALIFYIIALIIAGLPVFIDAVRGILRRDLLDEKFLMSIASIGAMFVGECSEGVAVMLFFLVGEFFEHRAVAKSRKSIRALMDIRPDEAVVVRDGVETVVDADDVEVGSTIVVRAGERVPIDSEILSGSADIDTSALTGESIPRSVTVGERIDSGAVVIDGFLKAKTLRVAEESAAARILELVENANERKSKAENFITKFSHYYTPIVVILALLLATLPPIFRIMSLGQAVYRALIFLVVSCPCALVISVPMAFFCGIGGAASKGILFKGGNVFSSLARADSFVFDKTGTLTTGNFSVVGVYPNGVSEKELLYIAASAEYGSNHPVALCIKSAYRETAMPEEFREIAGKGILARLRGSEILVGNPKLLSDYSVRIENKNYESGAIFVARDGKYIGYIVIRDSIKDEAKPALLKLRKHGAKRIVMLSGDRCEIAESVGRELEMNEVYSELLPQDKYEKLSNIIAESRSTVYVGDGINDAPALALADVGISMGEFGSDLAIEASDAVFTSDNLEKLPIALRIARKTVMISKENIIFALGVKALILVLGALGFANMWLAVFADVGVAAIAILNSMRALR